MLDWRPDIRIAERYEEPYERQVAKDLGKVEKMRQRAVSKQRAAKTKDVRRVTHLALGGYAAFIAVVIAVLVVSFEHMKVRTDHRQKELAMRTCMAINHQHWVQYNGLVYAYKASRAAHMSKEASRYLILAKESRKSMSYCRH